MLPDKPGAGRGIVPSGHNLTVRESIDAGVGIGYFQDKVLGTSDAIAGLAIHLAARRRLANERGQLLIPQTETILPPGQLVDPSSDNSDAGLRAQLLAGMAQVRDKVVECLQGNGHYKPETTEADLNRWMAEGVRKASEALHMADGHAKPILLKKYAGAARKMGFNAIAGGDDAPGTLSTSTKIDR